MFQTIKTFPLSFLLTLAAQDGRTSVSFEEVAPHCAAADNAKFILRRSFDALITETHKVSSLLWGADSDSGVYS